MSKNKAIVFDWYDDCNLKSYVLCLEPYGLKCLREAPTESDTIEIVLYGPTENVDKFLSDYEDDCLIPFDLSDIATLSDKDYEAWVNNEVNRFLDNKEANI